MASVCLGALLLWDFLPFLTRRVDSRWPFHLPDPRLVKHLLHLLLSIACLPHRSVSSSPLSVRPHAMPCLWLWDLYMSDAICFPTNFALISGQLLVSLKIWFSGHIPRSLTQVLNPWYRGVNPEMRCFWRFHLSPSTYTCISVWFPTINLSNMHQWDCCLPYVLRNPELKRGTIPPKIHDLHNKDIDMRKLERQLRVLPDLLNSCMPWHCLQGHQRSHPGKHACRCTTGFQHV